MKGFMDDTTALKYLRIAYETAAKESTDPSTQNGAVLYFPDRWGYQLDENGNSIYRYFNEEYIAAGNHFARGVAETEERWVRPLKYKFVEHSERNVIFEAARRGFRTEGTVMIANWFSCADCARAIIQAGIAEVIGHDCPLHKGQAAWKESIEVGDVMLKEAGIPFRRIPGHFGIKIRFNGEIVEV